MVSASWVHINTKQLINHRNAYHDYDLANRPIVDMTRSPTIKTTTNTPGRDPAPYQLGGSVGLLPRVRMGTWASERAGVCAGVRAGVCAGELASGLAGV